MIATMPEPAPNMFNKLLNTNFICGNAHSLSHGRSNVHLKMFFFTHKGRELSALRMIDLWRATLLHDPRVEGS